MALLKFHLPYTMKENDTLTYFTGNILFGIWTSPLSTETRLLLHEQDIDTKIEYKYKTYDDIMYFHNKYTRQYCFDNTEIHKDFKKYIFRENNIYCTCYDCLSELTIYKNYIDLINKKSNSKKKKKLNLDDILQMYVKYSGNNTKLIFPISNKKQTRQLKDFKKSNLPLINIDNILSEKN